MLEHKDIRQRELILFYTKTALRRKTPPTFSITVDYKQPDDNHLHLI